MQKIETLQLRNPTVFNSTQVKYYMTVKLANVGFRHRGVWEGEGFNAHSFCTDD